MTLGHAALLERIGSPFATWTNSVDVPKGIDLVIAALILSSHWKQSARRIQGWMPRVSSFLRLKRSASKLQRDMVTMSEYLTASWPDREYWIVQDGGESGCGLVQSLVTLERSKFNLTIEEALYVPTAIAIQDALSTSEQAGNIKLWTDFDRKMAKEAARG